MLVLCQEALLLRNETLQMSRTRTGSLPCKHTSRAHVPRRTQPTTDGPAVQASVPFHPVDRVSLRLPPHTQIRRPRSPSRNRRARSQPSVTQPLINYLFIFPPIYRCRRWLTKQNRSITSSLLLPSPSPILSPTSRFESCEQFIPIGFDPVTS
jgi:hypothetical protein